MTRSEVAGFIKGELMGRDLVKDPTVTVEFLNTGVSVMGEVLAPGRYDMNRDNITILEALSLAGDLTIQGKRDNVMVIREEDGQLKTYRVDLTNGQQLMSSPAFYLKQDDIVYVEPNGVRKRQTTVNGNTALSASFWVSVASLLTSVAVLIFMPEQYLYFGGNGRHNRFRTQSGWNDIWDWSCENPYEVCEGAQ